MIYRYCIKEIRQINCVTNVSLTNTRINGVTGVSLTHILTFSSSLDIL